MKRLLCLFFILLSVAHGAAAAPPAAPGFPTLNVWYDAGKAIYVGWSDNSNNEDYFVLYRCTNDHCNPGTWSYTLSADRNGYTDEDSSLSPGTTYGYMVCAVNGNGTACSNAAYVWTPTAPGLPGGYSQSAASNGSSITASWNYPGYTKGYTIAVCGGSYATCGTNWAYYDRDYHNSSFTVATVPCTTYQIAVGPYNDWGTHWGVGYANITTACPPAAPSIPVLTSTYDQKNVRLTWTDNATTETSYTILRCGGAACTPTSLTTGLASNSTSYIDSTVSASSVYGYQVCAVNGLGSTCSASVGYVTTAGLPTAVSLSASATGTGTGVQASVSWGATSVTRYTVNRCKGAGCSTYSAVWSGTTNTSGVDAGVVPGTTYRWQVGATNPWGTTTTNTSDTATPAYSTPATGLTASLVYSSSLTITWADNASDETAYRIVQCTGTTVTCGAGPWTQQGNDLSPGTTTLALTSLSAGTTYSYKVAVVNAVGASYSAAYQVVTQALPTPPSNLTATAASNGTSITLNWTAPTPGSQTSQVIFRCTGLGCSAVHLDDTGTTTTNYVNSGLVPNTYYRYWVASVNTNDNPTMQSTTVSADVTTPNFPITPSIMVTALGSQSLRVTWTSISNATGYILEGCQGMGCSNFATLATPAVGTTSYTDTAVLPGTAYTYRLSATNVLGAAPSNPASTTTWGRMRPQMRTFSDR